MISHKFYNIVLKSDLFVSMLIHIFLIYVRNPPYISYTRKVYTVQSLSSKSPIIKFFSDFSKLKSVE